MSLNADDVTLNNNVIPPNNNLNVTADSETEVPSQRIQNVYLSAVNGPRSVPPENLSDAERTRSLPIPTDPPGKNAQNDDGANLSLSEKENDIGLSSGVKFTQSPACPAPKTPINRCRNTATSNRAVIKLWVVVVITLIHCVVLMVAEHLTHSLTLRVEAYHSLYNVGVLAGSLLSIKLCQQPESLKNTFGWARIDVVLYLVSLIFLSSLCFSVAVEAAQTALHIHHQDPMHHPEATIFVCCGSLAVNAIVFFLIGGYTQHQGSFCELRRNGEVFINKQVTEDSLQRGQRTLSARNKKLATVTPSTASSVARTDRATLRQGFRDVLRDISGILLALLGAVVVFLHPDALVSYYLDSLLAALSVSLLMWLSYPFGKECSNILLQTIPDHIDVSKFSETLQQSFPDVLNVHHLHIWSLRPGQVVATVHMIFADKGVYQRNSDALTKFFQQQQISLVTLQPEFIVAEMATLPYCRCVDHLLDEAEDICDDFAMSHLDIHYHLHGDHHHHHHDEHHHHHGHQHNHEHVYYNENLHHHEFDHDNGRVHASVHRKHSDHHLHHGHDHDGGSDNHHRSDEHKGTSDVSRSEFGSDKPEQQAAGRSFPISEECQKDIGDLSDHVVDGSISHKSLRNEASDNPSTLEDMHLERISEKSTSKIKSKSEKRDLKSTLVSSDDGKDSNTSVKCESVTGRIQNDGKEETNHLVDSSTGCKDKDTRVECSSRSSLREKSKITPRARSLERISKTTKTKAARETSRKSKDHQSPQTSCSDLDIDEDLSYTYHKTSSEKKKGFEDGALLLERDHPKTKAGDATIPSEEATQ